MKELNILEILEAWKKENGLLTINLASQIIGITQPSVSQAVDKGKIKSYHFKKKRYLSFNDVMLYAVSRTT